MICFLLLCTSNYKQCPLGQTSPLYFSFGVLLSCSSGHCPSLLMLKAFGLLFLRETKLLLSQGHYCNMSIRMFFFYLFKLLTSSFFRFQIKLIFFSKTFLNLTVALSVLLFQITQLYHGIVYIITVFFLLAYLFLFILSLLPSLPFPTHTGMYTQWELRIGILLL